jgi:hypothetical protein
MSSQNRVGFVMLLVIIIGLLINLTNDGYVEINEWAVFLVVLGAAGAAIKDSGFGV